MSADSQHHYLFSYGTLQLEQVQLALFGRKLETLPDQLPGFRLDMLAITDPEVIRTSGQTHHPIITPTGQDSDVVSGSALRVSEADLAAADRYEVADYQRRLARLASGRDAWVYVDSKAPA